MAYHRSSTPTEEEQLYDQQRYMLVVDPISRKLNVPIECVSETLARFRQGTPSLCMLYLSNRCRQGPNCHQVHAEPSVVLALRAQAQQSLMCCMIHGDRAVMPQRILDQYVLVFQGGSGTTIPIKRLAKTQGLARFIDEYEQANGVPPKDCDPLRLVPSVTMICRLHGQDRCRFSEDCKFLHLCKELLWGEVSVSGMSPNHAPRRYSGHNTPPSPYHSDGMPPSPNMMGQPYSSVRAAYYNTPVMSSDSLISMDLTATPPMTPTSNPLNSPVIKCKQAGDSWSYEPYGFNPIPMMPPALDI